MKNLFLINLINQPNPIDRENFISLDTTWNENIPTRLRKWTTETVALRVANALWAYLKAERVRIVPRV